MIWVMLKSQAIQFWGRYSVSYLFELINTKRDSSGSRNWVGRGLKTGNHLFQGIYEMNFNFAHVTICSRDDFLIYWISFFLGYWIYTSMKFVD